MEQDVVVVTGASRGVGRETVRALIDTHGCTVIAVARDAIALRTLAEEHRHAPGRLETVEADLATTDGIASVVNAVGGRRVLALVNNAGLLIKRTLGEWTADDMHRLFALNVGAPLMLTQALLPALDGQPAGHVVNIGSMGGFQGSTKFPGLAAYSASKAALANLTECLAEEFKGRGACCNCLCIGAVDTEMLRAAFPGYRAGTTAQEMGAFVARFAMEGHKLFNGKVLPVSNSTP